MDPVRLHILGGSGSGTTTLGRALARRWSCRYVDVDDVFWLPTTPPYQTTRPREQRLALLQDALAATESWVLSGSLCGWGDPLIPLFTHVVFLSLPKELRMARLLARERERHGDAIAPGGPMCEQHQEFVRWAADYDEGDLTKRSRQRHDAWLEAIPCPVLRLDGELSTEDQVNRVVEWRR